MIAMKNFREWLQRRKTQAQKRPKIAEDREKGIAIEVLIKRFKQNGYLDPGSLDRLRGLIGEENWKSRIFREIEEKTEKYWGQK